MKGKQSWILLVGIVLVTCNIRAPITAVGALVTMMQESLGLSNTLAGFLTTLPLLTFAVISPFVSRWSRRLGYGLVMFLGLLGILSGELVRSYTGSAGLLIGTAMIGSGIAIGNVLIPSIIKLEFSQNSGMITSIYTLCICLVAALGSGTSVPLAQNAGLGWHHTLAIWAVVAIIALLAWLPQLKGGKPVSAPSAGSGGSPISVWRSPLAWQVTLFMGLQSLLFYSTIAWLPAILSGSGMDSQKAGFMALFYQLISIPAIFVVPILSQRLGDQRWLALASTFIYFLGMLLLMQGGHWGLIIFSIGLLGLAMGACLSLALSFIVLRSNDSAQAADLSGMSQSVGYLLAAVGPLLIGRIFDLTHSWAWPFYFLMGVIVALAAVGFKAGQNQTISQ